MSSATEQAPLHYAPMRILRPAGSRAMGPPVDADLQIINDRFASVPLTADEVFVFNGVPSTDAVDMYYTHMQVETSLRNFVGDFAAGQSLQDSHEVYVLGVGRSFRAELQPIVEAEGSPATQRVLAGYFIVRALALPKLGVTTDAYVRGIETGQWARLSTGFGGNDMQYICDIDGKDLWDSDYYPGQRLSDGRTVTYTVVDAHAIESSVVYRNATPGSLIERVQHLVNQRSIPLSDVSRLEGQWGTRFDQPGKQFFGGRMTVQEQRLDARAFLQGIHERVGKKISAATRDKLGSAVSRLGDAAGGITEATEAIAALLEEVDAEAEAGRTVRAALGDHATAEGIAALRADASAGKAYRADLIKETVQVRVAVAGDSFDATRYETRLTSYDVEDLRDEFEAWSGKRSQVYKPGRQVPVEDPEQPENGGLVIEERPV